MNKTKKLIFSLSGVGLLVAPLAATVSCGESTVASGPVPEVWGATDTGSKFDKSFNNQAYDVVRAFSQDNHFIEAAATNDAAGIKSKYDTIVQGGGKTILAAGFAHKEAIKIAFDGRNASTYKGINFILIDEAVSSAVANEAASVPNVLNINFKSEQGGFLAGVAAAEYAVRTDPTDPKVMTYGGQDFPAVTSFMAGFQQGVKYFNDNSTSTVKATLFAQGANRAGFFENSFAPVPSESFENKIRTYLSTNGVDVIFPVAGGQSVTILNILKKDPAYANKRVIGVDADLALLEPTSTQFILTSVLKNIATVSTAALNEIYGTNLSAPSGYIPIPDALKNSFKALKVAAPAGSLWGKSIEGGVSEEFVGISKEAEIFAQTGLSALKTGAKAAALTASRAFTV